MQLNPCFTKQSSLRKKGASSNYLKLMAIKTQHMLYYQQLAFRNLHSLVQSSSLQWREEEQTMAADVTVENRSPSCPDGCLGCRNPRWLLCDPAIVPEACTGIVGLFKGGPVTLGRRRSDCSQAAFLDHTHLIEA